MRKTYSAISIAILNAAVHLAAFANGIVLNEQSTSSLGVSYAGRSSSAVDASTVYGNPAGITKLNRPQVSSGMSFIAPSTDIDSARSSATGTNKGDMAPNVLIPYGFYTSPISDRWYFGLGLYVPNGAKTEYEKSFQGRYKGLTSEFKVVTVQPTIGYKINDYLSIGFGPTLNSASGKLSNNIANPAALRGSGDAKYEVEGKDFALGYNAGVLLSLTEDWAFGLTYHSKVKYNLEGRSKYRDFNGLLSGINGNYDASLQVVSPEVVDISTTYKATSKVTVYGGALFTRSSRQDQLAIHNSGTENFPSVAARLANPIETLDWKDTWSYAVGVSYALSNSVLLRAGMAYDPTPISNEHRNVRVPVGDRMTYTVGVQWKASDDYVLDFAYAYLEEQKVSVNQPATLATPSYQARYQNRAQGLGISLTRLF